LFSRATCDKVSVVFLKEESKMEENKKLDCSGDCGSCGEDCGSAVSGATVTLTLDDDSVIECAILTVYPCDGKEYIALLPLDENGENHDGEVYLYRYINDGSEQGPMLENIMDDDEYEAAADAFDELMDAAEFEEMDAE
jgi:hypothetical protein